MNDKSKVEYYTDHEHPVTFKPYFIVWVILLVLTGLTILVSYLDFGRLSTVVSLVIATIKAGLVTAIFMHLWHEKYIFKIILGVAILLLLIFIGLTFVDISFR